MNHIELKRNFVIAIALVLCFAGWASATELYIPSISAKPGQTIEIPIMIDKIDNLAGMKLALKYDANVLKYVKGEKTKHTSSLMHVVNDKNPGTLIIVMAGARGIKGEKIPLFSLSFEACGTLTKKTSAGMKITELQLMSDTLKEVEATIKVNDVAVLPNPGAGSPGDKKTVAPK